MFEVGNFVVYGNAGVCRVDKIGPLVKMKFPKEKIFYTLLPVYSKGSKVFTPVDSEKVILRPVLTKEDACVLIDEIDEMEEMWIPDNKKREETFKQSLRKCDCRELVKVIKTINVRREERLAEGKKVTAGDEKILHIAEENLNRELAIALDLEKTIVEEYISKKIEGKECQPIC
jgi:CarD family transcriptional regulator